MTVLYGDGLILVRCDERPCPAAFALSRRVDGEQRLQKDLRQHAAEVGWTYSRAGGNRPALDVCPAHSEEHPANDR